MSTFRYASKTLRRNPPRQLSSCCDRDHLEGCPTSPLLLKKKGTTWGLHCATTKNLQLKVSARPAMGMSEVMLPSK
eukprot:scaffold754_cov248-Pinguiococcus_pyrenoidosus.AAC.7